MRGKKVKGQGSKVNRALAFPSLAIKVSFFIKHPLIYFWWTGPWNPKGFSSDGRYLVALAWRIISENAT